MSERDVLKNKRATVDSGDKRKNVPPGKGKNVGK